LPPGWKWGPGGPYWTGEHPPEPPELPPGWEWGPLRPVWTGKGSPVNRNILGTSGPITIPGIVCTQETPTMQTFDLDLSNMLEPGDAFVYQIHGWGEGPFGETVSVLSEPQCLRYSPKSPMDEVEPVPTPCPFCGLEIKFQHEVMDLNVWPTVKLRWLPDDPMPLKAFAYDKHCLIHECPCLEGVWREIIHMDAKVRYEWEIIAGEGGFIKINDGTEAKTETGDMALYMPPNIEDTSETKNVTVKVTAYHDDPTKPPDHGAVTVYMYIKIKRVIENTSGIQANARQFVTPGDIEDRFIYEFRIEKQDPEFNPCPEEQTDECLPNHAWKKGSDINISSVTAPEEVAYGDHIRLEAVASDIDELKLECIPLGICVDWPEETRDFNDVLEYTWSADKGTFPRGNTGRVVIWQAPDEEGKVKIKLTVRDIGGQYDDEDKKEEKEIKVCKLGIDAVKIPRWWMPHARNGLIYGISDVYMCRNGKWEKPGRKKIIYFKLRNVSREPGICINYPPAPRNNTNPDLFFNEEDNQEKYLLLKDSTVANNCPTFITAANENPAHSHHHLMVATKKRVNRETPAVRCEDFGAYGKIEALANHCVAIPPRNEASEKPCSRTDDCCEGANLVDIPRDDNSNHISDGAPQDNGGTAGVTDSDNIPNGDGHNGDGYSNYEEYRGFITGHQIILPAVGLGIGAVAPAPIEVTSYIRTNIERKDIFINDGAAYGLGYFNASELTPHFLLRSHMDANRVVNFNHGTDHAGDQHGLITRRVNFADGTRGRAVGGPGVPRVVTEVQLSNTLAGNMRSRVVAHELSHACNVFHHGEGRGCIVVPVGPGGADRCRSLVLTGRVTSGVENCYMRYSWNNYYCEDATGTARRNCTWNAGGGCSFAAGTRRVILQNDGVIGSILCNSQNGTGVNAGGKCGGNATRGNCKGQLRVKDF